MPWDRLHVTTILSSELLQAQINTILDAIYAQLPGGSDGTSWVPLVTGAEPPVLVSDGAGQLVFVAWHP